jgi:competence protein ComEC
MEIYTLNVGQGQFVVVTSATEAIIVDTYVPINAQQEIIFVKGALTKALAGKKLVGLMVTGFDADHFNAVGLQIVLNKYRPNWIMYPQYFKQTETATECFRIIEKHETAGKIIRYSVLLKDNKVRFYNGIADSFTFEVFSPHVGDMTCSNNCSLVCKITERSTGKTYLVTGDTEIERWNAILRAFGETIECDVMAAPHHGSRNAAHSDLMAYARPKKVLISAGVDNKFDHPHIEAVALYQASSKVFSTNWGSGGQSLRTIWENGIPMSYKFTV